LAQAISAQAGKAQGSASHRVLLYSLLHRRTNRNAGSPMCRFMALRHLVIALFFFASAHAAVATGAAALHKVGAPGDHRIIARFAMPTDGSASAPVSLAEKANELERRSDVLSAKAYPHVGMVIIICSSQDAEDTLVEALDQDPSVELAVPDTWVYADDWQDWRSKAGLSQGADSSAVVPDRTCSAHAACMGLAGDCCPTSDGMVLACCEAQQVQHYNRIALRSSAGKYMVAERSGAVYANRADIDDWEKFHIITNSDGTVSLRTYHGNYVMADPEGVVTALSTKISSWEKFTLRARKDGSIVLKSHTSQYLVVDDMGSISARGNATLHAELFRVTYLGGPNERMPNDPSFGALWGMNHYAGHDIEAAAAWSDFTGEFSSGIVVAVIDTGIDYTHEDLKEQMWVNTKEIPGNGIDDDNNGYVDDIHGVDFANGDGDPMDDQMHGTHCAGTIAAAGNNGIGVAGVAWRGVQLMALKFLSGTGSGRTSDAISAIDYAVAHGAKIASNSWGGGGSNSALRVAIERAESAGLLFVAAAGNSGSNNDEKPHYPSNYGSTNVISVASTAPSGDLSGFSCYGSESVDVAAPGSGIFSTVPDNRYASLSGTSMACPHVSGLAALVWLYRPKLTMKEVKEIIMSTTVHVANLEGKMLTGLINAKNAMRAASEFEAPKPPMHHAQGLTFADVDGRIGVVAGNVNITAALDESDVEFYTVYLISGAGFPVGSLGTVKATGERNLVVDIGGMANSTGLALPQFAAGLAVVSGNSTGEISARPGGGAPQINLKDYIEPTGNARAIHWGGDTDLRTGKISGTITIKRAEDERTITNYNIYWRRASGERGPLAGRVQAAGFLESRCSGKSCSVINTTAIGDGGHRYSRDDYGNDENAVIATSGPGKVTITRFDTEQYYDILTVGTVPISGAPSLPLEMELPKGPVSIKWVSDYSETASGWSFELRQSGLEATLQISASKPLGVALEVVAAYQDTELPHGPWVEILDHTQEMPPLPSFGIVAGPIEVNAIIEEDIGTSHLLSSSSVSVASDVGTTVPSLPSEPWLHQSPPPEGEEYLQVWSASSIAMAGNHVLGAAIVPGLDASAITSHFRGAFQRILAAGLPSIDEGEVRLLRVLASSGGAGEAMAAKLDFVVVPTRGQGDLDRVEARLILLSKGGGAAKRFSEALAAELHRYGQAAPVLRIRFGEPQLMLARSGAAPGRTLQAEALKAADTVLFAAGASDSARPERDGDEEITPTVVAMALGLAAGAAAVALGAMFSLARRRMAMEFKVGKAPALMPLEAVCVHMGPDGDAAAKAAAT